MYRLEHSLDIMLSMSKLVQCNMNGMFSLCFIVDFPPAIRIGLLIKLADIE